jgi:hypothetical protein
MHSVRFFYKLAAAILALSAFTAHAGDYYVISAQAARLRSTPSLVTDDDTTIAVLRNHPRVEVLESKKVAGRGTWLHVRIGRREGWINHKLLVPASASAPVPLTPTPKPRPVVSTEPPPPRPPKPIPVQPKPVKPETAKPRPEVSTEIPRPPKPIPTQPEKADLQGEKCVSRLDKLSADEQIIVKPLIKSGALQSNWHSALGTSFSLATRGDLTVTMRSVSANGLTALATKTQYPEIVLKTALKAGMVYFNGELCYDFGKKTYSIKLIGTGKTSEMGAVLRLRPTKRGFTINGKLPGVGGQEFTPGSVR